MKIGRESPSFKPNAHTTKPSNGLVKLSKQVTKATASIPQAFTAGKLHFSKTPKSKNSEKITKLVHSRLKKVSYLRKK